MLGKINRKTGSHSRRFDYNYRAPHFISSGQSHHDGGFEYTWHSQRASLRKDCLVFASGISPGRGQVYARPQEPPNRNVESISSYVDPPWISIVGARSLNAGFPMPWTGGGHWRRSIDRLASLASDLPPGSLWLPFFLLDEHSMGNLGENSR